MSLSRFKKDDVPASRKFTDRREPLLLFKNATKRHLKLKNEFKVLVFYGKGGIGKSRLISEFQNSKIIRENEKQLKLIRIDLDIPSAKDAISMLVFLRKKLPNECILFDYALLRYWKITRPAKLDDSFRNILKNSLLLRIIEGGAGSFGLGVPLSATTELINKLNSKFKRRAFDKSLFEEIDDLSKSPKLLFDKLPFFLGSDLEALTNEKDYKYVFLFDGYERYYSDKNLQESEWLREFIASSGVGLFVVTSRELIKWKEINNEWDQVIDQHLLSELSNKDCLEFLKSIPINDTDVIETIISSTKGIPIYLDLCAEIFELRKKSNLPINKDTFGLTEAQIIEKFLSHLSDGEKEALKVLSLVRFFNQDIYEHILKFFNIHLPITYFDRFVNRTLIEKFGELSSLYKIHDVISTQLIHSTKLSTRVNVFEAYMDFISKRGIFLFSQGDIFTLFINSFEIAQSLTECSVEIREKIIEIGLRLHDFGTWIDVYKSMLELSERNKNLNEHNLFFQGICKRKFDSIENSIRILDKIVSISEFGKKSVIVRSEIAYIKSLNGNYKKAFKEFRTLHKHIELKSSDFSERTIAKIYQQYIDMLMMEGRFQKALLEIEKITPQLRDNINLYELKRLEGHIYRFNFEFDTAEFKYLQALQRSEENISAKGKLYVNLGETLCFFRPKEALAFLEKSLELNENIGSEVEIAKAFNASSIAYCILKKEKKAKVSFEKAASIFKKIGYPSGYLFTLVTEYILTSSFGSKRGKKEIEKEIRAQIKLLGVYNYLILPIAIDLKSEKTQKKLFENNEWLDMDSSFKNLSLFLERVNRSPN